jgi:sugar phosphate isomerase/epimerase
LEASGRVVSLQVRRLNQLLRVSEDMRIPLASLSLSVRIGQRLGSACVEEDAIVSIASRIKEFARDAAQAGMHVSFELHDDGILDSAAGCLQFLRLVDEPNTGVNPDVGNLMRDPEEPAFDWRSTLQILAPVTNCWHVKNYRKARMARLDDGEIDFMEAAAILRAGGVNPAISIEERSGEYREAQRRGLEFMKIAWAHATSKSRNI